MTTNKKSNKAASKSQTSTAPASSASAAPPTPAFLAPPPAGASIPSVPPGYEPTTGAQYRGIQPQTAEIVALPLAISDLSKFTNFASVMGTAAPSLAEVQQTFDVTNQWTQMRNASSAWDGYSRDQEGIAWTAMRSVMDRLKPAFALAVKSNPSIATTYPGLTALLGAKTAIAQKAAATRKKNKESVAAGGQPTHGVVGKARLKAAAKAALAAADGKTSGATPVTSGSTALAPTTPVVTTGASAGTGAAPASASPVAAGANGGTAGSGGATHD